MDGNGATGGIGISSGQGGSRFSWGFIRGESGVISGGSVGDEVMRKGELAQQRDKITGDNDHQGSEQVVDNSSDRVAGDSRISLNLLHKHSQLAYVFIISHLRKKVNRLDAGAEQFELFAVLLVTGVVFADFGPEGG